MIKLSICYMDLSVRWSLYIGKTLACLAEKALHLPCYLQRVLNKWLEQSGLS